VTTTTWRRKTIILNFISFHWFATF
jgi:hypothetical protein